MCSFRERMRCPRSNGDGDGDEERKIPTFNFRFGFICLCVASRSHLSRTQARQLIAAQIHRRVVDWIFLDGFFSFSTFIQWLRLARSLMNIHDLTNFFLPFFSLLVSRFSKHRFRNCFSYALTIKVFFVSWRMCDEKCMASSDEFSYCAVGCVLLCWLCVGATECRTMQSVLNEITQWKSLAAA